MSVADCVSYLREIGVPVDRQTEAMWSDTETVHRMIRAAGNTESYRSPPEPVRMCEIPDE